MTERERIFAAIRGRIPDRLPWVPRLEFWHRVRLRHGTLPAELRGLSLIQICDRLGVGCYASIPDYTQRTDPDDMIDRALGLFRLPVLPYRVTLTEVDRRVLSRGAETVVEYHTPVGTVRTATVFTEEMLDAGASTPWTTMHPIREPRDFEVVAWIFSRLQVEAQTEGFLAQCREVGDRGVVVGYLSGAAGPMHHIMKELMPMEQFCYALHDCPEKVEALAEALEPFYARLKQIAADSPAEIILLGANYDDAITYPRFFERHILPSLRDYAAELHARGKYLMTHTDGENRRLLPLYVQAGFDIADSVCPYPMTQCRLEDVYAAFAGRITIWGGIPSTLLCPESTREAEFRRTIDDLVARYSGRSRLILGVSDMVTADADWSRLCYVTERVRAF